MEQLTSDDIGRIYTWDEVGRIHATRHGIYQRNGRLVSLLTDLGRINPCYPDFEGDDPDTLFYTGAGRRGDQKLDVFNRSLHAAIKTRHAVPLFCKLAVNRWRFTGFWRVIDAEYVHEEKHDRHVWSFVLKRVEDGER